MFGRFIEALDGSAHDASVRAIDVYLSLFIFGFVYQIALTWDALRLKNTIQVIGLCAYNVGLMIYAAVQTEQIEDVVNPATPLWIELKPYLVAVPCIIAFGTLLMSVVAWKLYDEFSWSIYKHISADIALKRRYMVYQVSSLKFRESVGTLLTIARSTSPSSSSTSSSSCPSRYNSWW